MAQIVAISAPVMTMRASTKRAAARVGLTGAVHRLDPLSDRSDAQRYRDAQSSVNHVGAA